jgi:hypothetical protein
MSARGQRSGLGAAHPELREDHERLEALLRRLRAEADRATLAALLAEIARLLADHFRREEAAGGFYDSLGVSLSQASGEVGQLLDDHFRLVSTARDLAEQSAAPLVPTTDLREQALRLAVYLGEHEQREDALARRLTGGA